MSTNPLIPLYGPLYGSIYFGAILTTAFYGVTCMQTFFYYVHYQRDSLRMKILVASIWILNTIHQALTVVGAYKYITSGLLNPTSVLDESAELVLQILPTNLTAVITQGFLVYRLFIFTRKNIIAPLLWLVLGLLQIVPVMIFLGKALYSANGVKAVSLTTLSDFTLLTLATVCLSVAAAEDILIAICMTFLLIRQRNVSHFAKTTHVLQRLTVFAVNTGTWTATFAVLTLIFMHIPSFPSNIVYVVFLVPLCPVYCNTLLANLNARVYIGSRGETTDYFATTTTMPASDDVKLNKQPTRGANLIFSLPEQAVAASSWKTTPEAFLDARQSTSSSMGHKA